MQPNIIENFISEESCKLINNYLAPKTKVLEGDESHPMGKRYYSIFNREKQYFFNSGMPVDSTDKIVFDLINLIQKSISTYFNMPPNEIKIRSMQYTLLENGQSLPMHHDWGVSRCEVYSSILYLNDDYTGGEVVFYDDDRTKGTTYSPKTGTLLYFPGTEKYHHEVMPVRSGSRSNFVIFFEGITEKKNSDQVKIRYED